MFSVYFYAIFLFTVMCSRSILLLEFDPFCVDLLGLLYNEDYSLFVTHMVLRIFPSNLFFVFSLLYDHLCVFFFCLFFTFS